MGAGVGGGAAPVVVAPQAYPATGGVVYAQPATGYPGVAGGGAYAAQPAVGAPGAMGYAPGGYGGYAQSRGTVIPAPPGGTVIIDRERRPRRHRHRARSVDVR